MKPSNRAPKTRRRPLVAPQLSVVVPTFNERDNVTTLYRRLEATFGAHRLGSRVRRRQFARRHLGSGARPGASGSPRPLHPAHRPARPVRRLHRGHSGLQRALCRRDRRRPAARRDAAAEDAGAAAERARPNSWSAAAISRAAAPTVSTSSVPAPARWPPKSPSACCGVKVADPMSGFFMIRRDRFEQLAPQLSTQGFKILLDIVATARGELRSEGSSLHLRLAAAWREQARFHGGAGFPRPGAGEADPRRGLAALPAVRDGRLDRPRRASGDAVRRARSLQRAVCGSAGGSARWSP